MAKKEEIDKIVEILEKNRPGVAIEKIRKHDTGVFAVVKFLNEAKTVVKSKDISDNLGISSARMAVILKTMEKKELINKINSKTDARAISISLSDKGYILSKKLKSNVRKTAEKIIDEFGIEYTTQLFYDINKVKKIVNDSMEEI